MAFLLICLANSCSFLFPHSDGTHKKLHGKWVLDGTEKTVVFLILCIETQSCHADNTNGKCTNFLNMSFDACLCLSGACGAGSVGVKMGGITEGIPRLKRTPTCEIIRPLDLDKATWIHITIHSHGSIVASISSKHLPPLPS